MGKVINIKTNNLIGLSYMIDEYDEYCRDFYKLIQSCRDIQIAVRSIESIILGTKRFMDKRTRTFFNKYSTQIYAINNHVPFVNFMLDSFTDLGQPTSESKAFHEYLASHRDDAYKILDLLFNIKKLDIEEIMMSPEYIFTDKEYIINRDYYKNNVIYYLEYMKPIPSYSQDYIKYTTFNSNYEISVKPSLEYKPMTPIVIKVSSLLFDNSRLPKVLSKEVVFDDLISKAKSTDISSDLIRHSVDINVTLYDLEKSFYRLSSVSNEIITHANREEIISSLQKIREGLDRLQKTANDYDNSIVQTDRNLNHDLLEEEKNNYLHKRLNN